MVQTAPVVLAATDPLTVSIVATLLAASPLAAIASWRRAKPGAQLDTVKAMEAIVEQHRKDVADAHAARDAAIERATAADARAAAAEQRATDLHQLNETLEQHLQHFLGRPRRVFWRE